MGDHDDERTTGGNRAEVVASVSFCNRIVHPLRDRGQDRERLAGSAASIISRRSLRAIVSSKVAEKSPRDISAPRDGMAPADLKLRETG